MNSKSKDSKTNKKNELCAQKSKTDLNPCDVDKILYYDMSKRGYAVIINQVISSDGTTRVGSEVDADRLTTCLKNLNFLVDHHLNCKKADIFNIMDDVRKKTDISCLIVVVMAHGDNKNNFSVLDGRIRVNILWDCLVGIQRGIPKLFFIQACRGFVKDDGFNGYTETDGEDGFTSTTKTPMNMDILQMFSSNNGYYSYRDAIGTWFIKELCEVLENHADSCSLLELLTLVSRKVATKYSTVSFSEDDKDKKQMPEIVSSLSKTLKFNVVGKNKNK